MISDIFLKMANQQPLSAAEKSELHSFIDRTSKVETAVSSWIGSPHSPESPYIRSLHASEGIFDFVPTEGIICVRSASVSLPDDTETTITFDSGTSSAFFTRTGGSIFIPHTLNLIAVVGKAEFEDNPDGRRAVHINRYTEAGVEQSGDTLISISASQDNATTLTWAVVLYIPENSETNGFQMTVIQTSGGALTMNYMTAGLFVVR